MGFGNFIKINAKNFKLYWVVQFCNSAVFKIHPYFLHDLNMYSAVVFAVRPWPILDVTWTTVQLFVTFEVKLIVFSKCFRTELCLFLNSLSNWRAVTNDFFLLLCFVVKILLKKQFFSELTCFHFGPFFGLNFQQIQELDEKWLLHWNIRLLWLSLTFEMVKKSTDNGNINSWHVDRI